MARQPVGFPEGNVLLQLNPPDGERGGISPGDDAPYTDPDRRKYHPFPRGGGYCPPPLSCYRSARRIRLPIQKIPPERGENRLNHISWKAICGTYTGWPPCSSQRSMWSAGFPSDKPARSFGSFRIPAVLPRPEGLPGVRPCSSLPSDGS